MIEEITKVKEGLPTMPPQQQAQDRKGLQIPLGQQSFRVCFWLSESEWQLLLDLQLVLLHASSLASEPVKSKTVGCIVSEPMSVTSMKASCFMFQIYEILVFSEGLMF